MAWFRTWLYGDTADSGARTTDRGDGTTSGDDGASRDDAARAAREARPGIPGDRDIVHDDGYPGQRLGLPETGPGSVATLPRRAGQFVLDAVLAGLVAGLFTYPDLPRNWSLLAWAILTVVPLATIGMTPAMAMLGLRAVRFDRPDAVGIGPLWALVRTASVFFVIPALIIDRDVRGIHDRASRTLVIRTR